jgi:hypothetical protein
MNKEDKAELKRLVKEKAVRNYFLDKMHKRLANLWRTNQTKSRMFHETRKRYIIFENKIDELDERIWNLVPPGTHYKYQA